MTISISVGSEELRIIGHSISWQLDGPYEHTPPPSLGEQEIKILSSLHSDLCDLNRHCLSGVRPVTIEVGEPNSMEAGRLRLPKAHFRYMVDAVASFFGELRFSPKEMEIMTGVPSKKTSDLLSRLERVYHQLGPSGELPLPKDNPVQLS